jgi:hypothetical protein
MADFIDLAQAREQETESGTLIAPADDPHRLRVSSARTARRRYRRRAE